LARAGVGAALLPYRLGDAETCLRRVKGAPVVQGKDIWLLYHRDLRANPRVQTFSDFAFDEFVAERTRFEGRVNSG
jgi:DNA-binding transcriptional LysR family regulator